ncbi:hypothetical protein ACVIHC_003819 [Bradyrhizobium diazoefficiens]
MSLVRNETRPPIAPGAVDVGGRSPHDVDAADQFRIEEEGAVGIVAGALIVLPRAVDHDRDAAEILQAANVDNGRGIVAALLERNTGNRMEDVRQPVRLKTLDLVERDRADGRERVDRSLPGLGCGDRDGVERLHRRGAARLRTGVQGVRRCLLCSQRLGRLALGLLRPFRRPMFGLRRCGLRETALRRQCRD